MGEYSLRAHLTFWLHLLLLPAGILLGASAGADGPARWLPLCLGLTLMIASMMGVARGLVMLKRAPIVRLAERRTVDNMVELVRLFAWEPRFACPAQLELQGYVGIAAPLLDSDEDEDRLATAALGLEHAMNLPGARDAILARSVFARLMEEHPLQWEMVDAAYRRTMADWWENKDALRNPVVVDLGDGHKVTVVFGFSNDSISLS